MALKTCILVPLHVLVLQTTFANGDPNYLQTAPKGVMWMLVILFVFLVTVVCNVVYKCCVAMANSGGGNTPSSSSRPTGRSANYTSRRREHDTHDNYAFTESSAVECSATDYSAGDCSAGDYSGGGDCSATSATD